MGKNIITKVFEKSNDTYQDLIKEIESIIDFEVELEDAGLHSLFHYCDVDSKQKDSKSVRIAAESIVSMLKKKRSHLINYLLR